MRLNDKPVPDAAVLLIISARPAALHLQAHPPHSTLSSSATHERSSVISIPAVVGLGPDHRLALHSS